MKKLSILVMILFLIVSTVVGLSANGNARGISMGPTEVVCQYMENVNNHRLAEAYSLTDQSFREIIPIEAFIKHHEMLNYTDSLSYKIGSIKKLKETEAEVEIIVEESSPISGKTVSSVGLFRLIKENEEWKICLDWKQFYPMKVDLLPPIAEFKKDGVIVTLKYILLCPSTENALAFTHVRLDIRNSSNRQLRWQLPMPGTPEGYLEDPISGRKYYPSYAYGVLANMEQDFHYIPGENGLGTMLIGPTAEATLYIHIEEIIPDTVKELTLSLSGLSFCDNNENWNVTINNAPFHYEIVPNQ